MWSTETGLKQSAVVECLPFIVLMFLWNTGASAGVEWYHTLFTNVFAP